MATSRPSGGYRFYVLGLLTLVYAFNFIDRQIVTILAPYIKADLRLTDAQIGMLFGTAFALFYALFGLPIARLADGWRRVGTLTIGLTLWSMLTALSAGATSFGLLALARIGVGIGEASAAPAAFSLLQDYFGRSRRATALAIYSSGIYLGAGAAVMVGGSIVAAWDRTYAAVEAPLGLSGWQAAYLAAGLPGLLLALIVISTVREPVRGALDGQVQPIDPHPFRAALAELATLFPPFSVLTLRRLGASPPVIFRNLLLLLACGVGAALLVAGTDSLLAPAKRATIFAVGGAPITTNLVQWLAIAIGVYATGSWMQAVRLRDPVAARLTLGTPSFVAAACAGGLISLSSYGLAAFLFLFGTIHHGLTAADGVTLGAIAAIAGGAGTALGGIIADAARRHHPAGRLHVASMAALLSALCSIWQYTTPSASAFYVANFIGTFFLTMWLGPVAATCQDHVLPRMRGTATALQFLATNLIGLGLGPYLVGLISDITGDLRTAMLGILSLTPIVLALLQFAARRLPFAEVTLAEARPCCRRAGQPIADPRVRVPALRMHAGRQRVTQKQHPTLLPSSSTRSGIPVHPRSVWTETSSAGRSLSCRVTNPLADPPAGKPSTSSARFRHLARQQSPRGREAQDPEPLGAQSPGDIPQAMEHDPTEFLVPTSALGSSRPKTVKE